MTMIQSSLPIDASNATALATYYETHAIPLRLHPGIVVASVLLSVFGSYACLYLLSRRTGSYGARNIALLLLAASTMAFVAISSAHYIGMYAVLHPSPQVSWTISFRPAFIVASYLGPAFTLIATFLLLTHSDADGFKLWKAVLAGVLMGCITAMVHYSATFCSNFHVTLSTPAVASSILVGCLFITAGLTAFSHLHHRCQDTWWKQAACAIIIGLGIASMHYIKLVGSSYRVKDVYSVSAGMANTAAFVLAIGSEFWSLC